jgi:hypothetical protein
MIKCAELIGVLGRALVRGPGSGSCAGRRSVAAACFRVMITRLEARFSESFEVDGREMCKHTCSIGLEGVVSKVT